jgi:PEP-CTERM motif
MHRVYRGWLNLEERVVRVNPCKPAVWILAISACGAAQALSGEVVRQFQPVADTTIFANAVDTPSIIDWDSVSDGQGGSLWLGATAGGFVRRALLRFDLSSIPAGEVVVSASLRLFETRSVDDHLVHVHRLLAPWGEGPSNGGTVGSGAPAQVGDATWRWSNFGVTEWAQRGGDFVAQSSASTLVGPAPAAYTWSSTPGLVSDVQGWLDQPAANFGWILIGAEPAEGRTAKRFDSLQGSGPPQLWVVTTPVPEASTLAMLAAGLLCLAALRRRA